VSKVSSICLNTTRKVAQKGENLLGQFNEESDMRLNEDWNHQKDVQAKISQFKKITTTVKDIDNSEGSQTLESKD
jgi:hypothetical protein